MGLIHIRHIDVNSEQETKKIMNEDIKNEKENEEHSELTTDLQEMTSTDIPVEKEMNSAEENTEQPAKKKRKPLSINVLISCLLVCSIALLGLSVFAFINRGEIAKKIRDDATTPTSFTETATTENTLPSELTTPSSKTVLVDSVHTLPVDYVPSTLTEIYMRSTSDVVIVDEETGNKAKEMLQAASDAGINIYVVTAYRSYEDQQKYYTSRMELLGNSEEAKKQIQSAGCSEHQTGLALDFTDDPANAQSTVEFANTDAGKWLYEHAHEYGFILRYPEGKEKITGYTFEPWHYRYVGTDVSNAIYEMGPDTTFEEYYGINHDGQS